MLHLQLSSYNIVSHIIFLTRFFPLIKQFQSKTSQEFYFEAKQYEEKVLHFPGILLPNDAKKDVFELF